MLSLDAVREQIRRRATEPLYVLVGPDDRQKSELAGLFAEVVEPELRAFNVERFYGGDTSARAVLEAARTLPMMTDRRVVVVLQAERLLSPKRRGGEDGEDGAAEDLEPLVEYVGAAPRETTLVLALGPPDPATDGRKGHALLPLNGTARITKALAKHATIVTCGEFGSNSEVVRWLLERAKEAGLGVYPAAATRLVEISGSDAAKFRADAERVLLYAAGQGSVTVEHVDEVAEEPGSTDAWAIVRALERGDAALALRELQCRLGNGEVPFMILGQIAWAVRNPPPRGRYPAHKLPAAVDALFRTDLALKSSGDARLLLERLVVELCA
jgi:DNA polymerase III subunit delta